MIAIKFFILGLIFIISIGIGNLISQKYVNRVNELKDMKNALNMFETKIKFTYASIPDIFNEISGQVDTNVGSVFKKSSEKMTTMSAGKAWCESINVVNTNFSTEDKKILKKLGKLLGKTDIDGQISEIKLTSTFLDKQIETAENERNKNEKMYKTLGGIIGLTLIIILI